MSAVVILSVVKFSRFLVKDKSENTFIKYVISRAKTPYDTTNLEKVLQRTTLWVGSCSNKIEKLPLADTKVTI